MSPGFFSRFAGSLKVPSLKKKAAPTSTTVMASTATVGDACRTMLKRGQASVVVVTMVDGQERPDLSCAWVLTQKDLVTAFVEQVPKETPLAELRRGQFEQIVETDGLRTPPWPPRLRSDGSLPPSMSSKDTVQSRMNSKDVESSQSRRSSRVSIVSVKPSQSQMDSQLYLREAADEIIYRRVQREMTSPRTPSSWASSPRRGGREPVSPTAEPASPLSARSQVSSMSFMGKGRKTVEELMTPLHEIPQCERTTPLVVVAQQLLALGHTCMITADSIGLVTFQDLLHAYEIGVKAGTTVEWIAGPEDMPVGIPAHRFIKNTASRKAVTAQIESGDSNYLMVVTHMPKTWVMGPTAEDADVVGVISTVDLLSEPSEVPKKGLGSVIMV